MSINNFMFHLYKQLQYLTVTLVLLNPDMPCLCKQCTSRSVLQKPTYLDLHCLSLSIWICITNWIKQSDWLKIRSGRGVFVYSAWQGLIINPQLMQMILIGWCIIKPDYHYHIFGMKTRQHNMLHNMKWHMKNGPLCHMMHNAWKGPFCKLGTMQALIILGLRFPYTESVNRLVYIDKQKMPRLDCTDAHADLELCCPHIA